MQYILLDFSDSRFVSDPADGKNCVISSCTYTGHVNSVKVYCDNTASNARGLCGK